MKILVVSLLRVGDLIQQRPLLVRLKELYPEASLHVLTNRSNLKAQVLFPEVDQWQSFDREELQQAVGTAEVPLLKPVQTLESLVNALASEDYDLLLNMTHNRLSAFLCEVIPAREKRGLVAQGTIFRAFENEWLRHFNERFSRTEGSVFHYVEILAHAFGLGPVSAPKLRAQGQEILIQPLTSDIKKDFGFSRWRDLIDRLKNGAPGRPIRILGAPFEENILKREFPNEELAICGWSELPVLFKNAALLITGDTSVKHLAAQSGVPLVELALGSSHPGKMGAFAEGAWILQSKVLCAPCPTRRPCSQKSHLCSESLSPELVATVVLSVLKGEAPSMPTGPVQLSRTAFYDGFGWLRISSSRPGSEALIEKATWKLALDQDALPMVGTAAKGLSKLNVSLIAARRQQVELEHFWKESMNKLREMIQILVKSPEQQNRIESMKGEFAKLLPIDPIVKDSFWEVRDCLSQSHPSALHFLGNLKNQLERIRSRIELRQKLIQNLMEERDVLDRRNQVDRNPETP